VWARQISSYGTVFRWEIVGAFALPEGKHDPIAIREVSVRLSIAKRFPADDVQGVYLEIMVQRLEPAEIQRPVRRVVDGQENAPDVVWLPRVTAADFNEPLE